MLTTREEAHGRLKYFAHRLTGVQLEVGGGCAATKSAAAIANAYLLQQCARTWVHPM